MTLTSTCDRDVAKSSRDFSPVYETIKKKEVIAIVIAIVLTFEAIMRTDTRFCQMNHIIVC